MKAIEDQKLRPSAKFQKAKKKVIRIRAFRQHLVTFILWSILLLCTLPFLGHLNLKDKTLLWLQANVVLTPVIWGVVVAIHAVLVFKKTTILWERIQPKFLKDWEQRQLQKYMNEDEKKAK